MLVMWQTILLVRQLLARGYAKTVALQTQTSRPTGVPYAEHTIDFVLGFSLASIFLFTLLGLAFWWRISVYMVLRVWDFSLGLTDRYHVSAFVLQYSFGLWVLDFSVVGVGGIRCQHVKIVLTYP